MTERERAQDELLCGIGFTLAGIVAPKDQGASHAVHDLAVTLKEASAKQHDEDRNGVRRATKLEDSPDTIIHCEEPNTTCKTCAVRPRCEVSGRKDD